MERRVQGNMDVVRKYILTCSSARLTCCLRTTCIHPVGYILLLFYSLYPTCGAPSYHKNESGAPRGTFSDSLYLFFSLQHPCAFSSCMDFPFQFEAGKTVTGSSDVLHLTLAECATCHNPFFLGLWGSETSADLMDTALSYTRMGVY